MSLLVTIGTTSWRTGPTPSGNEVVFTGVFRYDGNGKELMVWDAGLNNMRAMTDPEVAALPGQIAAAASAASKTSATANIDKGDTAAARDVDRLDRAAALVALDAFNTDRACMAAMNAAVQGAASLAALKTAFAAISFPPQVTGAQLVTAIKNKIATLGDG